MLIECAASKARRPVPNPGTFAEAIHLGAPSNTHEQCGALKHSWVERPRLVHALRRAPKRAVPRKLRHLFLGVLQEIAHDRPGIRPQLRSGRRCALSLSDLDR